MRKTILLLSALLSILGATAQTYNNGTWYSLYDETGFEVNNGISDFGGVRHDYDNVFAPTDGHVDFNWIYTPWNNIRLFMNNNTHIYESANGGSNMNDLATLTDVVFDTEYTESIKIGSNINWLRWDRPTGNTHHLRVYNVAVPLAKHILLADEENEYGATEGTLAFEDILDVEELSDALTIKLRSFLTDGDITVSSSNPAFRVHSPFANKPYTIAVGANACASANGVEGTECAEGVLGNINFYDIDVYFSPTKGGLNEGLITITDGTSTVTVAVSGQGSALSQEIIWNPQTEILSDAVIEPATATSGLACTYSFAPEGIVEFADGKFNILSDGEVDITAHQAGNETYNPAEDVVRHFIIHPASTSRQIDAVVCTGEKAEYNGEEYEEGTYTFTYTDQFGADSVVVFVVSALPVYDLTEEQTITEGEEFEWNGVLYTDSVAGKYTQVFEGKTELGCDSVVVLTLTIEAAPVDALEDIYYEGSKPVKFFHEGRVYIRKGDEIYDPQGKKVQ